MTTVVPRLVGDLTTRSCLKFHVTIMARQLCFLTYFGTVYLNTIETGNMIAKIILGRVLVGCL